MNRIIRIGTRQSVLATAQSRWAAEEIERLNPGVRTELVPILSKGDRFLGKLDSVGGKGVFTNELEGMLLRGEIDFAVHSMKDMPAELPDGLVIAALSAREDPRDRLLVRRDLQNGPAAGNGLDALLSLPKGAVVGTSSARREVQLLRFRPDLTVKLLRGNVLTRIEKLKKAEYDAILLAAAGLNRLGMPEEGTPFAAGDLIPAAGQGIIGIEARRDAAEIKLLRGIDSADSQLCLQAERAFIQEMDGGCTAPIAAFAEREGACVRFVCCYLDEASKQFFRREGTVPPEDLERFARSCAGEIRRVAAESRGHADSAQSRTETEGTPCKTTESSH